MQRDPAPVRLLLVEDHEPIAEILTKFMGKAGYAVTVARTVSEARELLAGGRFDAMVSDIGLPDGTGWDLMTHARARYGLRGIALSGQCAPEDIEASRIAGFDEHLRKPSPWAVLHAAICRTVRET